MIVTKRDRRLEEFSRGNRRFVTVNRLEGISKGIQVTQYRVKRGKFEALASSVSEAVEAIKQAIGRQQK